MMEKYEQRFPWRLDWNLLRTFMVVVDQGGITPAANFLGLKQPTISAALKRLEDSFDRKLINRTPNHFSVTPLGQVVYAEARAVFGTISQLPNLMAGSEDQITGHVSLAVASHVVSGHFDRVLEAFNTRHPQVTYTIASLGSAEVVAHVQQNRATLGLCLLHEMPARLNVQVLFREFFGFYCGPRHRLFGRSDIRLAELKGEDAVSFHTEEVDGPLYAVAALRQQVGMKPGLKGVSSSLPEVRRMIISNIGIGALPVHVAQKSVEDGVLWHLPPYTSLPAIDIYMLTNPKRRMNRAEQTLLSMLQETLDNVPMADRTYRAAI